MYIQYTNFAAYIQHLTVNLIPHACSETMACDLPTAWIHSNNAVLLLLVAFLSDEEKLHAYIYWWRKVVDIIQFCLHNLVWERISMKYHEGNTHAGVHQQHTLKSFRISHWYHQSNTVDTTMQKLISKIYTCTINIFNHANSFALPLNLSYQRSVVYVFVWLNLC